VSRLSGTVLVGTALAVLWSGVRTVSYAQPNDEAQIRALEDRFARAFIAKDMDGIMANYEHSRNLIIFDVGLAGNTWAGMLIKKIGRISLPPLMRLRYSRSKTLP